MGSRTRLQNPRYGGDFFIAALQPAMASEYSLNT